MFDVKQTIPIETRTIQVNGTLIRYEVAGRGQPVVLVHGLSGSTRWWIRNIPPLAHHYQLFLVDLPGFGSMRKIWRDFTLATAADWLADVIRALGLQRVHIIGHSMGGYIALRLAALHPELVEGLVLAAPAGVPGVRTVFGEALPLLRALRYGTPGFLPVVARDALRAGPRSLLRATLDLLQQDVRPYLKAVRAPVLLIWGSRDALVSPASGEVLRQALAQARLVTIPRAGHVVMYDAPDEFNAATMRFLGGERAGR